MKPKLSKNQYSDDIRKRIILVIRRILSSHNDVKSRSAFAERIHTVPQTIHKWENLMGYPTIENIADICFEFSISADWLITGTGKMFGDAELNFRIEELEKRMGNVELKVGIKNK